MKTIQVDEQLYDYILQNSLREPEILRRLRDETAGMEWARMQISPDQGQFLALLVQLLGARKTIEVGVFTGYSALSTALVLPEDGTILACDTSEEWTAIARRYFREAGLEHKLDLRIAPATETLQKFADDPGNHGAFDSAFIDADKVNYRQYFELCLQLIRRGGLIAIDNTLWGGAVADPSDQEESTRALRDLNASLHKDDRIDLSLVPIADGLTLCRKRYSGPCRRSKSPRPD